MDDIRKNAVGIAETVKRIRSLMPKARLRDREAADRGLKSLSDGRRVRVSRDVIGKLVELEDRLNRSVKDCRRREQQMPGVSFPRELPISAYRREIVRSIQQNRVVIIAGETGCGKSTQIPKMCLSAGRGISGQIACTQPRRIAATTIARRIAEEMGEPLGRSVGYKIRFQDKSSPLSYIKIMTDGMLLAETQSDPRLMTYDTLIIDEAHERSLNIDFLLGITRILLAARPELRLVVTSATLDTEKFSRAFEGAPVIEVGGRMFPVEVEYHPGAVSPGGDEDYVDMAVKAVSRLKKAKRGGDILIFMPTELDILETCERLEGRRYTGTTVLPLFARLPAAQQGRVYGVTGSKIVVATNVAETSLTIPGIKYVIDSGLARISQYQPGTRINSLPVSDISRSSADQRMGRCGRVREGVCIRLYSQQDYESRIPFTPPEILRSNLAEVILRMMFLNLGHPSRFPFVDRPKTQNVKDGYDTLLELGAIRRKGREIAITAMGRVMARMPLDPKISRMLLEAKTEGCLRQVAVIAAVLSIRDPRERPPDKTAEADRGHAVFKHPDSDFLTLLNIWDKYHDDWEKLNSQGKRRKFCREHFLSFSRMREWVHVHNQILEILKEQKIPLGKPPVASRKRDIYAEIHKAVLSGFLSNIAVLKEKNIYQAAKGREVMMFPGSALFNAARPWVVAAEMVETSRLFARTAARIESSWLEALGGSLCRYSYSEARWDPKRGEVRARERVTLYGLEIVSEREVSYGRINPEEAHRIFVRSALVEGRIEDPPAFLRHNLELCRRIRMMEEKLRKHDILVGEEVMTAFYSRILEKVADLRSLERKIRERGSDDFLRMKEAELLRKIPDAAELNRFPDELNIGGARLRTAYRFAPGEKEDGVTLEVPASLFDGLPSEPLEWGVPGQLREKITALIKGLPKRYRKQLLPVADTVDTVVREMKPKDRSLSYELSDFIKRRFQVVVPPAEWEKAEISPYLRMRVALTDEAGRQIKSGRDLAALRREMRAVSLPEEVPVWERAREKWERIGVTDWDFDSLPERIALGAFLNAYPGLEPTKNGVNIRLFKSRAEALSSHLKGVQSLLIRQFAKGLDFLRRILLLPDEYGRTALFFKGKAAIEALLLERIKREVFQKNLRTQENYNSYTEDLVPLLHEKAHILRKVMLDILDTYQKTRGVLLSLEKSEPNNKALASLCAGIRDELAVLLPVDFPARYPLTRLLHFPRYLDALRIRAERGRIDPLKDREKVKRIGVFIRARDDLKQSFSPATSLERRKAWNELRWMIEEFKVSLFAPELKTAGPVSPKRLTKKLKEIEDIQ